MHIVIVGRDLPGRTFCDQDGIPYDDVRVGLQVRREPEGLVPGDAERAQWELDVRVVAAKETVDFRGPAVHGVRGDRFLYLTWGNVDEGGGFEMFRRAKLMLNRIDPSLVVTAVRADQALVATVRLSDERGAPRCARVDPPDIAWTVESHSP